MRGVAPLPGHARLGYGTSYRYTVTSLLRRRALARESILVVGFGRFGRAITTLLSDEGHTVRAIDAAGPVPAELEPSPGFLDDPAVVLLCVPVTGVGAALESVAGSLGDGHLVVDVCSVRAPAEEAMRRVLGTRVPWIGTHPLFGPSSIALGERPLRVVVCPNEMHPGASARARRLYESIGCDVIEEASDAHDQSMAYSHALAFFLAKGMLDMDAAGRTRFVPPSFQAMLRTIDAVRSDAGHLFYAIEALNPYAADARTELLAALTRLHEELASGGVPDGSPGSAFDIPDLGEAAPELRETRDLIDDLDRRLVRLVAQRSELAVRAGSVKGRHELPVRDPAREQAVLRARRAWAEEEGLDQAAVGRLFEELMAIARNVQRGNTS